MKKFILFVALIAFCIACTETEGIEREYVEISPNVIEIEAEGASFQLTPKKGIIPDFPPTISEYAYCSNWETVNLGYGTPGYMFWGNTKNKKEDDGLVYFCKNPLDDTKCISIKFLKKEDGKYDFSNATVSISKNNSEIKRCYRIEFSGINTTSSIRILQNEK